MFLLCACFCSCFMGFWTVISTMFWSQVSSYKQAHFCVSALPKTQKKHACTDSLLVNYSGVCFYLGSLFADYSRFCFYLGSLYQTFPDSCWSLYPVPGPRAPCPGSCPPPESQALGLGPVPPNRWKFTKYKWAWAWTLAPDLRSGLNPGPRLLPHALDWL